ncbi:GntR family transcriptional regulator [Mangrovibrevibacter kandeliae]|uniref:GntR family transcriptional regulator n=1 Tax=Mangrovibrevibacter kandeliae TaxID=2968473 RepID=UPI002117B7FA|nr:MULTISPECIES: GntR family transcriptional regulator [unclassified Aurantimonas]MCQ8781885.1 GntR family transcriptional regulator [Aurantimonas sp. CSK15Z-1]MCW4115457.1 GntR family transcriptional regulator [Aurantimonas sp. MSK8Z-1]
MSDTAEASTAQTLRKSPVARYIQLAGLFRRRIESGEWVVGSRMPTVEELAGQCGVSNMTIRQSLDILESEGLIERYRAKGTFVTSRPKRDLWCQVHTDWSGLLIARENAEIEILSDSRNVDLPFVEEQIGAVAPAYRHLRRRHSRDGAAFLLTDVYLDERLTGHIAEESYTSKTAMRLVADIPDLKIVDARQVMTIGMADLETATRLNIPLGEPVAKVRRLAVDETGTLVLVANGLYRGDLVKIEVKLR